MPTETNVRDSYPEIELIESDLLREKVIDGWVQTLERSQYDSLEAIPGLPLNRGAWELDVSNVEHTRAVTRLARAIANVFNEFSEYDLNLDYVTAGALCHDMGKYFEFDELETGSFIKGIWETSEPGVRHPIYSAAIAWEVEFPPEVIHIVANHAREGEHIVRSPEANIVHYADHLYWIVTVQEKLGVSLEELFASDKTVV